ncbi:hypothetical protein CLOSTMETH_00437 [[Clostridium] methylpentosum DSM 5476]|uniref:Uncharacterized protein n=1 Tax=[Clostridium] methylpentosum DSM 5476 TaxID=537013 RepID=C0E9D9_9FIRM|nr:hypothetical protein CLOSTMETH_00437 [[Clostridium] methylpentosum DSM 5476]
MVCQTDPSFFFILCESAEFWASGVEQKRGMRVTVHRFRRTAV